jgi:O-acetylserine/cysteine efflux transporter
MERAHPAVFFMGGLHFALIFSGVKYSDASTMAIVNQLYVPYFGAARDGLARRNRAVAALARHRARLLWGRHIQPGHRSPTHVFGLTLLILDAVAMAVGTVLLRKLSGVSPFSMQGWMAVIGIPFLFATSFVFESGQIASLSNVPWQAWAGARLHGDLRQPDRPYRLLRAAAALRGVAGGFGAAARAPWSASLEASRSWASRSRR